MTTTSRFLLAALAILALSVCALQTRTSRADQLFTVSLTPAASAVPAGSDGAVIVRLQSQQAAFPGLSFDADGGEITSIVPLNTTGAGTAEGTVYVHRDTPGNAHVTASFAGSVLAESNVRFEQMAALGVSITLDAGPNAAARTWHFEVLNPAGAVVASLSAGTSGDKPTATASADLPYGFYTVRQLLSNDTKLNCTAGAFYQVTAPVSGETTIELASSAANASFTVKPCGDLPAMSVSVPIDTVTTPVAGSAGGDVPTGVTPVDEVRGVRQAGPGATTPMVIAKVSTPSAPSTGSGIASHDNTSSSPFALLAIVLGLAFVGTPVAAYAAIHLNRSSRR